MTGSGERERLPGGRVQGLRWGTGLLGTGLLFGGGKEAAGLRASGH